MHASAVVDHQSLVAEEKVSWDDKTYLPPSLPADGAAQLRIRDDRQRRRRAVMSKLKHICFLIVTLGLLAMTFVSASNTPGTAALSPEEQQFRELLETLDATTLHEIIREHFKDKYQPGVYQEDKTALEALHSQDAEVAQSLVRLAKRQDTGTNLTVVTTTTTTIAPTTTTTTTTQSPEPSSSTTTSESTSDQQTTTSTTSESPLGPSPTPTPSLTPPSSPSTTTTSSSESSSLSSTLTTTTRSTTLGTTTSYSNSSSTLSTSPTTSRSTLISSSITKSMLPKFSSFSYLSYPNTTSDFHLASSTSTRRSSATEDVTVHIVYTTILNGAPSVVTRYTVVPADQAGQITGNPTGTGKPTLQTNLASPQHRQEHWNAGLGFLGLAAAYLL